MIEEKRKEIFEDDEREKISLLIEHRLPWLFIGLIGGMLATVISSHFEEVLSKDISLVFFIPVIVYLADAVGTQTETVYVRNLSRKKVHFLKYLFKEIGLGLFLGVLFGICLGAFAYFLRGQTHTAFIVGLSVFASMTVAPVVALVVPSIIFKEHGDPAVGAGPFTTVIQDLLSIGIYFLIASFVINHF